MYANIVKYSQTWFAEIYKLYCDKIHSFRKIQFTAHYSKCRY